MRSVGRQDLTTYAGCRDNDQDVRQVIAGSKCAPETSASGEQATGGRPISGTWQKQALATGCAMHQAV